MTSRPGRTPAQTADRFDAHDYRRALGQYPTGVAVITTRGADGNRIGLTSNSFTSVSLDPPLVGWSPSKQATHFLELESAPCFRVNVLAADQDHLSRQFAASGQDKFKDVRVTEGMGGLPLIEGAVAHFQCRTVRRVEAGDHMVILGEVARYDADGGEPLVYHSGRYHSGRDATREEPRTACLTRYGRPTSPGTPRSALEPARAATGLAHASDAVRSDVPAAGKVPDSVLHASDP